MRRLLICLLLALLSVVMVASPAAAQSGGTYVLDFTASDYGFTISPPSGAATNGFGTWVNGVGFESAITGGFTFGSADGTVSYSDITEVRIYIHSLCPTFELRINGTPASTSILASGDPCIRKADYSSSPTSVTGLGWYVDTSSGSHPLIVYRIELDYNGGPPPPAPSLTKPLANDDTHPQWGMYDVPYLQTLEPEIGDGPEPFAVISYSDTIDVKVAAVADGTVISVVPYDCEGCVIVVPEVINQSGANFRFGLENIGLFKVIIQDADDVDISYEVLLANPDVIPGDAVAAGCILGRSIQMKRYNADFVTDLLYPMPDLSGLGLPYSTQLINASFTVVLKKDAGVSASLYPQLTLEPSLDDCAAQNLSGCLNDNSDLRSLDAWTVSPNVTLLNGGGVTMGYQSSMYQGSIVIDEMAEYVFTVQARTKTSSGINDPAAFTMVLGNDADGFQTQGFPLTTTWKNFTFAPTTGSLPSPLTIGLQNSGPTDIEIRYVCFASGLESIEHGSCYFQNHEFEGDEARWTVFGDTTFTAGQAYVRHDGTFEQAVTLNTNADTSAHTYVVSAQMRLLANPSYTGQAGKSVTVNYRFPQAGSYTALGTIDSALVNASGLNPYDGAVNVEYPYVLEDNLVISADTTGLFSFQVQVTDAQNYLTGVRFDWVCIRPTTDDGSFPGQDGPGGYEPPFFPECAFIPTPLDGTVGAWTYYHWKNLERVFKCDLMVLLNDQFEMLNDFQTTIRHVLRYWIVLAQYVGDWSTSVFHWLNGHLGNIAIGQVTTIFNGEEQCNNLFCAADSLFGVLSGLLDQFSTIMYFVISLLTQGANLLFSILLAVVTLVTSMLVQIMGYLQLGQQVLVSILSAYNGATPIPIDGLPQCATNPQASGFCAVFWMADNTILSGPGEALVPLAVSILSIHMLLWLATEIKKLVTGIGRTL